MNAIAFLILVSSYRGHCLLCKHACSAFIDIVSHIHGAGERIVDAWYNVTPVSVPSGPCAHK